jgi:hypothetical protein
VIYLLIPKPHLTSLRCALTLHPKVLPPREKAVICFHTHLLDLTLMRGNLQTLHPQVLPPPKWKLWLVIWFSVFTISLAFTDANVQQGLMDDGWLDFEPALFVRLFISVTFIIYACVSPSHLKCTLYRCVTFVIYACVSPSHLKCTLYCCGATSSHCFAHSAKYGFNFFHG